MKDKSEAKTTSVLRILFKFHGLLSITFGDRLPTSPRPAAVGICLFLSTLEGKSYSYSFSGTSTHIHSHICYCESKISDSLLAQRLQKEAQYFSGACQAATASLSFQNHIFLKKNGLNLRTEKQKRHLFGD